jgi:hypothetical protein
MTYKRITRPELDKIETKLYNALKKCVETENGDGFVAVCNVAGIKRLFKISKWLEELDSYYFRKDEIFHGTELPLVLVKLIELDTDENNIQGNLEYLYENKKYFVFHKDAWSYILNYIASYDYQEPGSYMSPDYKH